VPEQSSGARIDRDSKGLGLQGLWLQTELGARFHGKAIMNPFEQYAADLAATRRPSRVRVVASEASAPMVPTPMEKAQRDQSRQFALYSRGLRAQHKAMLAGVYGDGYRSILALLKPLTPDNARALVRYIRHATWINRCSEAERSMILSVINTKIMRHREENGMSPMDDPLPGQPLNLYLIIRRKLLGV